MDQLSAEDALRLNVLLANKPQALRIDESSMVVYGLSEQGEARVPLNPNCRDEQYLRRVREVISGHVLGSPGGYPVYLKRWTRMGQARDESLDQLLLLGEPEAVVAAVHATGLTNEQARRAWWAMPTADNARRMLLNANVVAGDMGKVLADYLVDYLPFEEEPINMIESVRLVLQPGLVDAPTRAAIWAKGRSKSSYYLGFLLAVPDDLPEHESARADFDVLRDRLDVLAADGNAYARLLLRVLDGPGQAYLSTVTQTLRKPLNQDVVNLLLDAVAGYFAPVQPGGDPEADLEGVIADADRLLNGDTDPAGVSCVAGLDELRAAIPELTQEVRAMLILSRLGYPVVRPIFSRTTAVGSLMRRKLEPVTAPVVAELGVLQGLTA